MKASKPKPKPKPKPRPRLWQNRSRMLTVVLPDGATEQIRPAELRRRLALSSTPAGAYRRLDIDTGLASALHFVEPDPVALEEIEPPDLVEEDPAS